MAASCAQRRTVPAAGHRRRLSGDLEGRRSVSLDAGECPPVPTQHPEAWAVGELLHHQAITMNFNYTSPLAAELRKNNKRVKKKQKAEKRLLQSR